MDMDLREAAKTIKAAVPGVRFCWGDYNGSLSVAHPTKELAFVVYQVARPDRGRRQIVGDVPTIIARLLQA